MFTRLVGRQTATVPADAPVMVRLPDGELHAVRSVVVRTIRGDDAIMISVKVRPS